MENTLAKILNSLPLSTILKALQEFAPSTNTLLKEATQFLHIAEEDEVKTWLVNTLVQNASDYSTSFYLKLTVGQGGMDAQDWTQILHDIYINFFAKYAVAYETEDISYAAEGLSSALLFIKAPELAPAFTSEEGIHRLERISPFKSKKSIQTSEASVSIIPFTPNPPIQIKNSDIRIIPIKSGGPGGQHANKNLTGVRLVYSPKNLVLRISKYRSFTQNKQLALNLLKSILYKQYQQQKQQALTQSNISEKMRIVRTYDFTRDTIKSHIYPLKVSKVKNILKGNLEIFVLYNLLYDLYKGRQRNQNI